MKKIVFLIAIFTGISAFGQQEHSGGISIATGFKLEDPQPIDDKYVVADSASLINLPNVYEGLWSYSKADSAIFVYDGVKWGRIGGVNGFIELSKSQLDAAIGGGNLVAGALYKITGVNPELYGGTDIYLTAISATELNPNGVGKFYNPKYDKEVAGFGIVKDYVWWADLENQKESGEYDVDDVVIWGGKHWVCVQETSISTKYIVDDFELDTDYFEAINYNETDYNIAFDAIKYDYENDWIIERNEKGSNVVSFSYDWLVYSTDDVLGGSVDYNHPIRGFMWGNIYDDAIGIGFQTITNSLNRNINFSGNYQSNLTFNNNSFQTYLTFENNSYQSYLTFENDSSQYYLTFDNSSQSYLTLDNSRQSNLTFDNSSQSYLTFDNSTQSNLTFDNSYQSHLTFDNSYQSHLTFDNSYQSHLTFENDSSQSTLTFNNDSHQSTLTFENNSFQTNLTATNGYSQQDLYFKSYGVNRIGLPLTDNEVGITYDNTSQGLKLKGTEVFSITDDEDYIQKKYVDDEISNLSINSLSDTPANFTGAGGKFLAVNSGATGVEYRGIVGSDLGVSSGSDRIPVWGGSSWTSYLTTAGTSPSTIVFRTSSGQGAFADPTTSTHAVTLGYANTNYQPLDGDLTSIAGISGTSGLLRKTAANTWSLDTNTYATTGDLGALGLQEVLENGNTTNQNIIIDDEFTSGILDDETVNFSLIDSENSKEYLKIGTGYGYVNESARSGYIHITGNNNSMYGSYLATEYLTFGANPEDYIPDSELVEDKTIYSKHGVFISKETDEGKGVILNVHGLTSQRAGINSLDISFPEFVTGSQSQTFQDKSGTIALVEDTGSRIIIPITDDFTLPAMSAPPTQNSFGPITILEDTELPDDHIDWEITWKDSGYTYKLSSLGDFNTKIRESGGDIQIGGQTRSASDIVIDADTMEPVLILEF